MIIIQLTQEELEEKIEAAIKRAIESFPKKAEQIEYLTRKEVAALLHISLPTLNNYTKDGVLRASRISGRVLYKKEDVHAALTSVKPLKYRRR